VWSEGRALTEGEGAGEGLGLLEWLCKMKELCGEMTLEVEAREVDNNLTPQQRSGLDKIRQAMKMTLHLFRPLQIRLDSMSLNRISNDFRDRFLL
jgi:hypothetical protein